MNPNQSENKFSIQINLNQFELGLIQTEFSIRIDPNHFDLGFIRIDSDWKFGYYQSELALFWIENLFSDWFGFIRIDVSQLIGFIFDRFLSNEIQNVFRIGSEWFALARIQISEWFGIVLIDSEWISIRYYRQGTHLKNSIIFIINDYCATFLL